VSFRPEVAAGDRSGELALSEAEGNPQLLFNRPYGQTNNANLGLPNPAAILNPNHFAFHILNTKLNVFKTLP